MAYCSSLCTFGSVYFCFYSLLFFFDHPEIYVFFDSLFCFLLIPRPLMEYCSSLCTFGSVYFFVDSFLFFLDPLKSIYIYIFDSCLFFC